MIPSAGPYRVASYTPGQGVVLTRNPNYHGSRPHRLARIELAVGDPRPARRRPGRGRHRRLRRRRRGRQLPTPPRSPLATAQDSPAAKSGHQQYFVNPATRARLLRAEHPPAAVRRRATPPSRQLRDRPRRAGPARRPLFPTARPTPPITTCRQGSPATSTAHIYPLVPDLTKARRLAKGHAGATAVLYTCDRPACTSRHRSSRTISPRSAFGSWSRPSRTQTCSPGSRRRASRSTSPTVGWVADYPDPQAFSTRCSRTAQSSRRSMTRATAQS